MNEITQKIYDNATDKGFWDREYEIGTILMLIISELVEAFEADRRGDKDGMIEELVDVVITTLSILGSMGVDVDEWLNWKMAVNEDRPRLHGKLY